MTNFPLEYVKKIILFVCNYFWGEIAFIDLRLALFSFRLLDGHVRCMCCKSGLTDPRFS